MTPSCVAFARYVREVDNGAPLKEISLKKLIGSIRKMFDDAATIGLCKFNPFHSLPQVLNPSHPASASSRINWPTWIA